jgi:hypothetical protein
MCITKTELENKVKKIREIKTMQKRLENELKVESR